MSSAVENVPAGAAVAAPPVPVTAFERRFGNPPGLFILFFTEMWERFSYYGMRGLLKLYMVNYLFVTLRQGLQGGGYDTEGTPDHIIGWDFIRGFLPSPSADELSSCITPKVATLVAGDPANQIAGLAAEVAQKVATETCAAQGSASLLYGFYTGLVYLTPLIGGYIADKYLGQRKTVVVGGLLMALGHFVMAFENSFFLALALLILGNGAFKPNISTQVGSLYAEGDPRRDGAFTIFYMGINLGAFICNFVCGTLAAVYGWHYGFGAAGIGMLLGLMVYLFGQKYLAPDNLAKKAAAAASATPEPASEGITSDEWKRIGALLALCTLNVVFWAVYEQQGNTMQTWADEQTVWPTILGWQLPSTWFQSFNPFFIFVLAPVLDRFWAWQNRRGSEPSTVSKMAIGSGILGLSFIVMVVGAQAVGSGKGSLFWPVACTLMLTIGELYLSPIGLSLVSKAAPKRMISLMMGMWLMSSFFGNMLSGYIGVWYTQMSKEGFFGILTVLGLATAAAMWAFNKPLKRALGSAA